MSEPGDRGRHRRGPRWWQRGPYVSSHREARETRETREVREARETRETRETREARESHDVDVPGRFIERSIEKVHAVTAPVVDDRPQYTWRDFELDDQPARAEPHRPDAPDLRDGRRHCGPLERVLFRQWDAMDGPPSADAVRAVDGLARLPEGLKAKLAIGLDGIYIGRGGVPDLDDMGYLRGAPLPSGRATWDICAGAYGDRKIVVGDRPSPTPDVMMHEVGHALDDVDASPGQWVSDSPEFAALYDDCMPMFASAFHRQPGGLGRKEFFADAFAAIASRQRPALVDMLGGDTRTALNVMLFFNRRYGI
ncbi:hypothetical protein Psi02_20100 [Planotetraspora silvatica]|uniref:Uncharacterized protein n=1 Tax=Planotetraspora silvatica TaxID=234614 RepID=A0A8J3ULR9_9ACTN|nr:hypothetical protein [Planotetraspora silvatica]GII45586.1 hypothetical protein Psi02_20100 [Planotetraspora silvatica]